MIPFLEDERKIRETKCLTLQTRWSLRIKTEVSDAYWIQIHKIQNQKIFLNTWLYSYAKAYKNTKLSVAEGGVFRGDFAKYINKVFPDSKLYLFDTFEGFDHRDVEYESNNYKFGLNDNEFSDTSLDVVMEKMEHPKNIIIKKGFFPETAADVDDRFCFVHLDFDLYVPILEGLRFFYPKMVEGSVILIHDYYNIGLPGVKDAIEDYEKEIGRTLYKTPIGEDQSIAIIKDSRS